MTDLTDPLQVEILPGPPPDLSPIELPAERPAPHVERRRSRRFTVRTSTDVHSYASWERAVGAARSFAVKHGLASTITDDNSGTRFDVAPDGCASPSSS